MRQNENLQPEIQRQRLVEAKQERLVSHAAGLALNSLQRWRSCLMGGGVRHKVDINGSREGDRATLSRAGRSAPGRLSSHYAQRCEVKLNFALCSGNLPGCVSTEPGSHIVS